MSKATITCIEKGCTEKVHRGADVLTSKDVKPGKVHCNAHQFCPEHLEDVQQGNPPRSMAAAPGWSTPIRGLSPMAELCADLALNHKNSPWAQAQGSHGWVESLCSEAQELSDAIRLPRRPPDLCQSCKELRRGHPFAFQHEAHHVNCTIGKLDLDAVRDEMGDVLWNLITLAIVTGIDFDAVVQVARDKLRRRKPWIFGIGPMPKTAEEERAMYTANKSKEKP